MIHSSYVGNPRLVYNLLITGVGVKFRSKLPWVLLFTPALYSDPDIATPILWLNGHDDFAKVLLCYLQLKRIFQLTERKLMAH